MVNKMAISEFLSGEFWDKMSKGGGLGALQFFLSLRKDSRTFNFRKNEPFRGILRLLSPYDHPWGKNKKQTNKQKKTNKKTNK